MTDWGHCFEHYKKILLLFIKPWSWEWRVCVRGRMSHQDSPSDSQHHHSARLVFFFFSISDLFSSCEKFLCLKNFHIFRNQTYQTSKQPDAETRTEIILQLGSEARLVIGNIFLRRKFKMFCVPCSINYFLTRVDSSETSFYKIRRQNLFLLKFSDY